MDGSCSMREDDGKYIRNISCEALTLNLLAATTVGARINP